jgi:hypothetical protein
LKKNISIWAKFTQVSDVAHGPLVLFMLSDIHLICHIKIQFKFGSDLLIFHEFMALRLRKVFTLNIVVPHSGFAALDIYK